MNKKKKWIVLILAAFLMLFCFLMPASVVSADDTSNTEQSLADLISQQLENLNLEDLEEILSNLTDEQKEIFGTSSFLDKVKALLTGEQATDFAGVMSCLFALLGDNVLSVIPVLSLVCAVAVLAGLLSQIRPKTMNKSLGDIIHFVCFGFIVIIVFGSLSQLVVMTKNTLLSLQAQMEIGFPILLTLMTAVGATASVGIYQPSVAILTGFMLSLCVNVLLPIFVFSLVFHVAGNLSSNVKLNKFAGFFSNAFKWIVGLVFTVFAAFLTIQGISAGSYDGISIRTAKYAMKSYIPILGSYLADGLNLILSSSILIKNAVGFAGLLLLFATIIGPLLKIIVLQLGLNLIAGVLEPVADSRTSGFLSGVAKSLNMLIAIILAFSFAYFITVALIMCTSNVIG